MRAAQACFLLALAALSYGAILGVDLGSEWGILSVWRPGKVGVIADDVGHRKQQEMISFDAKNYLLNGDAAEKMVLYSFYFF